MGETGVWGFLNLREKVVFLSEIPGDHLPRADQVFKI
jgi:hypothetical protein